MCGIVCALDINEKPEILRPQLLEMSKKLRHRGPDWSGIFSEKNVVLAHERLAIVDPKSGCGVQCFIDQGGPGYAINYFI